MNDEVIDMSEVKVAPELRENKMRTMPVGKLLFTMSLPLVISMLVQALYNVIDSVYVSHKVRRHFMVLDFRIGRFDDEIVVKSNRALDGIAFDLLV